MKLLSLTLFGGFALTDAAGTLITLRRKKARLLFSYLALDQGRAHPRAELANLLWGGVGDSAARTNLRQNLRALHQALGPAAEVLAVTPETIGIRAGAVAVDVCALAELLDAVPLPVAQFAATYRGRLLDGLVSGEEAFDRWRDQTQEAWDQRILERLRAEMDRRGSDPSSADVARCILRIDPSDEDAHRRLIAHHLEARHPDRALRQFQTCRRALREELDLAPSAETVRLVEGRMAAAAVCNGQVTLSVGAEDRSLRAALLQALLGWRHFAVLEAPTARGDLHLSGAGPLQLTESASGRLLWIEAGAHGADAMRAARVAQAVANEIEYLELRPCEAGQGQGDWGRLQEANRARLSRSRTGTQIARRLYAQILMRAPEHVRALSGFAGATIFAASQGWLTPRRTYVDAAVAAIEKAVQNAPRDASARVTQSSVLLNAGRFQDALAAAALAVELNPGNAFANAHLGVAYQGIGDVTRAAEYLTQGLALAPSGDPRSKAMQTWFARALLGSGAYDDAERIGRRQIRLVPDYGPTYVALASALVHRGDAVGARRIVEECEARLPGFIAHRRGYRECQDSKLERHLNVALFA